MHSKKYYFNNQTFNNKNNILRPRLARLHFTSEAVFWSFNSVNSSISEAGAVLVNRLAKQLHI
jgi:IS1 family transposase